MKPVSNADMYEKSRCGATVLAVAPAVCDLPLREGTKRAMASAQDYGLQPATHDYGLQPAYGEGAAPTFDVSYIIGIVRRRALYFAIPFLLMLMAGIAITEMQRPIYRAEGEVLLESPAILPDLLHPTVTELPDQRFEVIKQRILAEANLLGAVDKYDLFPKVRASVPAYRLLDIMRKRVELNPVPLAMARPGAATTAFTVSFDYEEPSVALKVVNDFITQILSQDTTRRTSNATEAANLLEQEVRRLEDAHNAVVAQILAVKQRPPDRKQVLSEQANAQMKSLVDLEQQLVQKSSIYSDEHPVIKELKRKIAALKRAIASEPQAAAVANSSDSQPDVTSQVLQQQEMNLQRSLDDANRKLAAARLGESLEKNQQAEHLQLIANPSLPHDPVRPKKLKWLGIAFVLAGIVGAAFVVAAEMLDRSVRRSSELAGIVGPHMIVSIPYLATPGEQYRRRRNLVALCMLLVTVLAIGIGVAVAKGVSVDFEHSWLGLFTRIAQ